MRAVSFGGAFLTTAVPDFLLVSAGATGEAAAGLSGPPPGVTGLMGLMGETAPWVVPTGLIGLMGEAGTGATGLTAPLAMGEIGTGGVTFGVTAAAMAEAGIDMAWVRRGGAIMPPLSCLTGGGTGEIGGFG